MRILLTGGSGFVGKQVLSDLLNAGHELVELRRVARTEPLQSQHQQAIIDLAVTQDFYPLMDGIEAVVHLAAQTPARGKRTHATSADLWRTNVEVTRRLGEAATRKGVRRFVFLSSINVHGHESVRPLKEDDPFDPRSDYARSKVAAERALDVLEDLPFVILRPPLVLGQGLKGNLGLVSKLARQGVPLPAVLPENRRSFVGLRDLSGFISECLIHPSAARQHFLVADPQPISTAELFRLFARAGGHEARLVPLPRPVVAVPARLARQESSLGALWMNLEAAAPAKATQLLGWTPRHTLESEVQHAVQTAL
ncbi:MAG: NAD-dependent epimerase/dehydratase family protein [Hyphomicrobiales bacterium]|nr:MAG: NAD-dependent epimerase/dehydratase family protein [Hyphomicrobiales bacterium]